MIYNVDKVLQRKLDRPQIYKQCGNCYGSGGVAAPCRYCNGEGRIVCDASTEEWLAILIHINKIKGIDISRD